MGQEKDKPGEADTASHASSETAGRQERRQAKDAGEADAASQNSWETRKRQALRGGHSERQARRRTQHLRRADKMRDKTGDKRKTSPIPDTASENKAHTLRKH